jgi:phospholipid/cholesterol/gamma-HCH transport system substrate-binding protein
MGEDVEIKVDFDTSVGLKRGASVKVAGLKAGRVEKVDFRGGEIDPEVKRRVYVRIHLSIKPAIAETLREDARFYITTTGLLGEKYVEIDPGSAKKALGSSIKKGIPPMRIEVMAANLNTFLEVGATILRENKDILAQTMKDVQATAKAGREAVEAGKDMIVEARQKIREITEKSKRVLAAAETALKEYTPGQGATGNAIKRVASQSSELVSTINRTVGDGQKIKGIIDDVRSVTSAVKRVVGSAEVKVLALLDNVDKAISDATGFIAEGKTRVSRFLTQVEVLMKKVRDGEGTIGALLNDREMYDDAREMMKDLKRHPWKFLWKE